MTDDHSQLPDRALAAALAAGGDSDQCAEAFAEDRGWREYLADGSARGLVTVGLTNRGPAGASTPELDPRHARPDVVCDLRPSEARQLAGLLDVADRIDPPATDS